MKLVSIIMAAYNADKYIYDAIESCLNQTYSNIELIIINDGSTDNTLGVIQKFNDKRIVLINQTNQGQCKATNVGLKQSSGQYIQFLDADDLLARDKIHYQVEQLDEYNGHHISFCYWIHFVNEIKKGILSPQQIYKSGSTREWFIYQFRNGDMLANSCYLIPRQIFEKSGYYDEELNYNNDFEYFNRTVFNTDYILFNEKSITYYRKGLSTSMTSRFSTKSSMEEFDAKIKTTVLLLSKYDCDMEMRNALNQMWGSLIYKLITIKNFDLISKIYFVLKEYKLTPFLLNDVESRFGKISHLIGFNNTVKLYKVILMLLPTVFLNNYTKFKHNQ